MNAFDVLDALLMLEQSEKGIREFFEANDIKDVTVYGLGRVGVRVVDAIRRSGVGIKYGIDKDASFIHCDGLEVIHPDEIQSENTGDLIIITPMDHYFDIKEELEERTNTDIISIEEIVEYCMDGEELPVFKLERTASPEKSVVKRNRIDRKDRSSKILVFGGGSGIGKAIAKKMANEGSKVIIAGRNIDKLSATKEEVDSANIQFLQADISEIQTHLNIFEEASSLMGGLDTFVNAAAVSLEARGRGYEPWDITEDEWDEMSDTDFKGAFFLIRNEVDYFIKNKIAGNILNISSNAACMDISGIYGASKKSVMQWTRTFGKRFGHDGIVINAIAPGATVTPMISNYARNKYQSYPRHAIDRFIIPEEIAELAAFMMSEKGVILCGTTVVADGGDAETVM